MPRGSCTVAMNPGCAWVAPGTTFCRDVQVRARKGREYRGSCANHNQKVADSNPARDLIKGTSSLLPPGVRVGRILLLIWSRGAREDGTVRTGDGGPAKPRWPAARVLLLQRVGAGLGDLCVLLRGVAGDPDGADDLAVHDDWNAALERAGTGEP